jgi:hypothetical protein
MTDLVAATPLVERLEQLPKDARLWIDHGPLHSAHFPVGLMCHEAASELNRLRMENEGLQARLDAVQRVIETGYPSTGLKNNEKCEHGSFGFENCMGCYDEALLAALHPAPPVPTAHPGVSRHD